MNGSWPIHSVSKSNYHIQLTDRLLAIYSLLLILIGTPCNILCCLIYFQKSNRANSIKTIFGYLAVLDTIVLYTFNLNYVFREFNVHVRITYHPHSPIKTDDGSYFNPGSMNIIINKKNLEEHSILICRCLSYLAFSTLQTSSWILAFGSFNRYLLIKNLSRLKFLCQRRYSITVCLCLTGFFFLSNIHILWMNGYRSTNGHTICYTNLSYPKYMVWYQRLHLFLYSVLPTNVLMIFNTLLIRLVFESKKRLDNHKRLVLFAATATTTIPSHRRRSFLALQQMSSSTLRRPNKNAPSRILNRHSRKLTISLILITISYFTLTFPSTVIFSFFRPYIEPVTLRRTLSLFFTNLSTTTHAIRFFIYFFCSTDFRKDFYDLFLFKRLFSMALNRKSKQEQERERERARRVRSTSDQRHPPIKLMLKTDKHPSTR